MDEKQPNRRFRYSLKALFVFITVVIAYLSGWQHGRIRQDMELKKAAILRDVAEEDSAKLRAKLQTVEAELEQCKQVVTTPVSQ